MQHVVGVSLSNLVYASTTLHATLPHSPSDIAVLHYYTKVRDKRITSRQQISVYQISVVQSALD